MKKIFTIISIFTLFIFTGCSSKEVKNQDNLSQKQKAIAVLKSIETYNPQAISYIDQEKFIQHDLKIKDGVKGIGEMLLEGKENNTEFKVNPIRVFQDGNFVFTHSEYDIYGPKVGFDIFRFENNKIVEHWNNITVKKGRNLSDHSLIDGATEIKDLELTKENKMLVQNFLKEVMIFKHKNKIDKYIDRNEFIQHNSDMRDGISNFKDDLKFMEDNNIPIKYDIIHIILGEGNFVLVVSEGQYGGVHTSFYDLFRVKNNKIVEHWDILEEIPPKEKWQNQNGKF